VGDVGRVIEVVG